MNSWNRLANVRPETYGHPIYSGGAWLRTLRFFIPAFLVIFTATAHCAAASSATTSTSVAVERGLQFLQKEAFRWKETRRCAACHHAPTMIWTFNEAKARGYSVDENALKEITGWAFADMQTNSLTPQAPPRDVINLGWVYVLLSVETAPTFEAFSARKDEVPPTEQPAATSEAALLEARQTLVRQIVSKQASDGAWGRPLDERVPVGGPTEDIAILSRLALLQSGDKSTSVTDCINKAAEWLGAHQDGASRQARNFRVLMNVREAKPGAELNSAVASIRAEQNADGGWSQTPAMASDAYATGQTLYVLARAGVRPEAPEMKRGVEFLKLTQRDEGSWPMTSRVNAKNLSPITAAGTAWGVLGLLRASP